MLKSTYIFACLFALVLALAPSYAEHAKSDSKAEESSDSESKDGDEEPEEQTEKEKTEEEKRKAEVDKIVAQLEKDLEKAKKEKLSDDQKKELESALDALIDPSGSLAELSPEALEQALKLLQDKLAHAEGEEEKSKVQSAIDRGTQQIEKIAEAKKNLEKIRKLAEGYVTPALNALSKFSANPEKAVGDAARTLGESIAKQSNTQAAAAKSHDSGGWAATIGAAAGTVLGGAMLGPTGAVVGGVLGYGAGSYVGNQAQQAGGYANYANSFLGGGSGPTTNYTDSGSIKAAGATSPASSSAPESPTAAQANGGTTAGTFALNGGAAAASSDPPASSGTPKSSGTPMTTGSAGSFGTDTIRSDLDAALSQASSSPAGTRGSSGAVSRPGEYVSSSGSASATAVATATAVEEPSFQERVAEVMAGMPGNQAETSAEEPQERPTAQGTLAAAASASAVLPTIVPAANAAGATQAAAAQAATQASIDAAKIPEAVARTTASEGAKGDDDTKAAAPIARTDGGSIYSDASVKKAAGEKATALESYSTPSVPGPTNTDPEPTPENKPTTVAAAEPEVSLETQTRNAMESLLRTDAVRGLASTTETTAPTTAAPLPGKLTIAGLTNPQVSEATIKAFQAALPRSLAGTIPVGASNMDRDLLKLFRNNNGEIAQRGISSIKPKAVKTSPGEPSPNAIVKDGPKGDVFSRFFAGQI